MLFYIIVAVAVTIVLYFGFFRPSSNTQRPTIKKDPRLTAVAKPTGTSPSTGAANKKKVSQDVCFGSDHMFNLPLFNFVGSFFPSAVADAFFPSPSCGLISRPHFPNLILSLFLSGNIG